MDRSHVPKYVMSTLCRICAEKSSKLTPIFESELFPIKIDKCLPIKVKESDFLPLKVCEPCFYKIDESYALYESALEADQRLRKLWKILLKETSDDLSANEEKEAVGKVLGEEEVEIRPSNLVINIPEEMLQGIEILNDKPNEVVIMKAVSFEVISEAEDTVAVKSFEQEYFQTQIEEIKENQKIECQEIFSERTKQYNESVQCSASPVIQEPATSEGRPFLCDTCGKSFKHANNLRNHARTHSGNRKKCICKVCGKGFVTNFFLQEHMNSHTGETPYKCTVCGKEFREKVHLRQHKWTHSTEKFVCQFCGNKFNRKGNMTEHIKKYHRGKFHTKPKSTSKKKSEEDMKEKNFKCPACNCEFPNQTLLKNHLKIHPEQKRFSCSICSQKFRHSGSLTYHRRTAHTGEKPFQCSYCEQKFSLRSVQKIHERKMHTFENPYRCSYCSQQFTNSSSLRNHLYIHTNEKLFECDECGKKFARSSNLVIHKKLHSDDRKFSCDQCGKRYIQKHDLMKHKKVHDPKSRPFFCKYCGNSFSHKKDSSKHAMCQFDFLRKNSSEFSSAEKILDSVKDSLEDDANHFLIEEQQILDSVEELSGEKISPVVV